jgi:hypothetical protein
LISWPQTNARDFLASQPSSRFQQAFAELFKRMIEEDSGRR